LLASSCLAWNVFAAIFQNHQEQCVGGRAYDVRNAKNKTMEIRRGLMSMIGCYLGLREIE
jgi:hypothetical protein